MFRPMFMVQFSVFVELSFASLSLCAHAVSMSLRTHGNVERTSRAQSVIRESIDRIEVQQWCSACSLTLNVYAWRQDRHLSVWMLVHVFLTQKKTTFCWSFWGWVTVWGRVGGWGRGGKGFMISYLLLRFHGPNAKRYGTILHKCYRKMVLSLWQGSKSNHKCA